MSHLITREWIYADPRLEKSTHDPERSIGYDWRVLFNPRLGNSTHIHQLAHTHTPSNVGESDLISINDEVLPE